VRLAEVVNERDEVVVVAESPVNLAERDAVPVGQVLWRQPWADLGPLADGHATGDAEVFGGNDDGVTVKPGPVASINLLPLRGG